MKSLFSSLAALFILSAASLASAGEEKPRVQMQTSMGDLVIELYPQKAPKTVANFLQYVDEGFYNGTIFHRVINGFMIQGGGFTADFDEKETRAPIPNEADNRLRNTVATIAMARTSDPHSATSQFYINLKNNSSLDHREKSSSHAWGYAVFGRVVKGLDVVGKIKSVTTGRRGIFNKTYNQTVMHGDVPVETVLIRKVSRLNSTAEQSGAQQ